MYGVGQKVWRSPNSEGFGRFNGFNHQWGSDHRHDNHDDIKHRDGGYIEHYRENYYNGRSRKGYTNHGRNQHHERKTDFYKHDKGNTYDNEEKYRNIDQYVGRSHNRDRYRYTDWGRERGRDSKTMLNGLPSLGLMPYGYHSSQPEQYGVKYQDRPTPHYQAIAYRWVGPAGIKAALQIFSNWVQHSIKNWTQANLRFY